MRRIPAALRDRLDADPLYHMCIFHRVKHPPIMKIEWHHNLIFAGQQVNEDWAILPLCVGVHDKARDKHIKERLDWIMLNRAPEARLRAYSKAINYLQEKNRLNGIYGAWPAIKHDYATTNVQINREENRAPIPGGKGLDHSGDSEVE